MNTTVNESAPLDEYFVAFDVRPNDDQAPQLTVACGDDRSLVEISPATRVVPLTPYSGSGVGAYAGVTPPLPPPANPGSLSAEASTRDRFTIENDGGHAVYGFFVTPGWTDGPGGARLEDSHVTIDTPTDSTTIDINATDPHSWVDRRADLGTYEISYERLSVNGGYLVGMMGIFPE